MTMRLRLEQTSYRASGKTDPDGPAGGGIGAAVRRTAKVFAWVGAVFYLIVRLMVDGRQHRDRCGPGVGRCGRSSLDV